MSARIDYLICRRQPNAIEGVVYFRGSYSRVSFRAQRNVLAPDSSMFRSEATIYEEATARLIAAMLNDFGPASGLQDAVLWQALPAVIVLPAEQP